MVAVAFLYPVARLVWLGFSEPSFGLQTYAAVLSDPVTLTILLRTLRMSAIVTAVTLVLGYPYAYVMTLVGPRARAVLLALVLLPFWTSLMARTFAWVVLLQERGPVSHILQFLHLGTAQLKGTAAGVTIGMAQVLLPFMVLPLYSTMKGIDRRLIFAAQSMGARPASAFRLVYLPLSLPGVVAGVTLVLVLALGFYITPLLLGSPQQAMISQLIALEVNNLDFRSAGALSFILLAVTLAVLGGVARLVRPSAALGVGDRTDTR
ncbi:ABC transporter permease [Nocardia gipuzkoensis]